MNNLSSQNTNNIDSEDYKILIIGQGDIGLPVTNQLASQGLDVSGLARGKRSEYDLNANAKYIQADALEIKAEQLQSFTHITIVVTPDNYDAHHYKNTYFGIAKHIANFASLLPQLKQIVFISSTGVYGQDAGEWIDETVPPVEPKRESSKFILQAEQILQQTFAKRAIIIRPSGIYGKQRLMRVRKAKEAHKNAMPKYAWSNRIMDTDLINIIVKVITASSSEQLKPVYIATDYAPVTSYELTSWLAEKLGSSQPPIKDDNKSVGFESDSIKIMSGKRLHSNIPRNWLQYPDWESGYLHILDSM